MYNIRYYCCGLRHQTHNKLRKTLPVIPLVNDSERFLSTSWEISREEHRALQNRVHALEVFLREYVVDVKYLEKIDNIGKDEKKDLLVYNNNNNNNNNINNNNNNNNHHNNSVNASPLWHTQIP